MACDIEVRVVEARNLMGKVNGSADPYCVVIVGKQKKKTKTVKKNLNPSFHEPFTIDIGDAASFAVAVYDKGSPGKSDYMGEVVIPCNGLKLDGTSRWFPLKERPKEKKVGVQGEIMLQFAIPTAVGHKLSSVAAAAVSDKLKNFDDKGEATLDLEGVELEGIPKRVLENAKVVASLQVLSIGFNKFHEFPDLSAFTSLTTLNFSGNQLTAIPPQLGLLTNLRELRLNGNSLKTVPPELGDLTKLEKLDLSNNQLSRLPDDIGLLRKLEELNLTGNPLAQVPAAIGECVGIESLDLSCCELVRLPDQFTYMTRILELNLGTNRLEALPEAIGRMSRLVVLNLSDNLLRDLPMSIGMCVGLGKLGSGINLARNPIKDEKMLKKWTIGTDHLLDYLEKRMMQADGVSGAKLGEYLRWEPDENRMTYMEKIYGKKDKDKKKDGGDDGPREVYIAGLKAPISFGAAQGSPQQARKELSNTPSAGKLQPQGSAAKLQPQGSAAQLKPQGSAAQLHKAPSTPTIQRAAEANPQDKAMEEKLAKLSEWVTNTVSGELSKKLIDRRTTLQAAQTIEQALQIASVITSLKADLEKLQALIGGCGVPIPESTKAPLPADKLGAVKTTVTNAINETMVILKCVPAALSHASQQQVIAFVQGVKSINQAV